jgi:dolichol-phosphate mannosyltransferase
MRTLAIIPTYNEVDNLRPLIGELLALDPAIDLLVVDDNSPDGTGPLADALAAENDRVAVLHRLGKQGLASAYIAGFQYALERPYDAVIHMDADFSHRPEDVPRLLRALDDADVVIGSRRTPGGKTVGWSPARTLISAWGSIYARFVLGLRMRDCTGGFKALRRRALLALDLPRVRSNGYAFHVELNYAWSRAGLRVVEVPIVFPDRVRGESKMSAAIALEAAVVLWRLRFQGSPSAGLAAEAVPAPPVVRTG